MRKGYVIKNKLFKILVYVAAILLILWLLLPLYWTLTTSFSRFADIKLASIFPLNPTLENYGSIKLSRVIDVLNENKHRFEVKQSTR